MGPSRTKPSRPPDPPGITGGRTPARSAFELARARSHDIDERIRAFFDAQYLPDPKGWCITAVGGYGRQDLCPHSDIDILIILKKKKREADIQTILSTIIYPLWDWGLSASYSIRTIRQAVHDCRSDFFFLTALLDMRFLCGDERICSELARDLQKARRSRRAARLFYRDLTAHDQKRHEKFGDASYILEPDLKDGLGGLRDYHSLLWLANYALGIHDIQSLEREAIISPLDRQELEQTLDFILHIRTRLHTISGRKNDRLDFAYQEIIGREMAFEGCRLKMAVELLMKRVHRSTLAIKSISTAATLAVKIRLGLCDKEPNRSMGPDFRLESGLITFADPNLGNPACLLTIFEPLSRRAIALHPHARSVIRNNLELAAKLRIHPEAGSAFLRILQGPYAAEALTTMLELGLLERFLPEWGKIRGRIQYDVFHTYTVDMHSIHTVTQLRRLSDLEPEVNANVHDHDAFFLAALLHDIGKGHGRDHAQTGAGIAYTIARRLGLPRTSAEFVRFLVAHHLLLVHTALRRDLSEEKVPFECARRVMDAQHLAMLYLITIADSKATGESAWNGWKALLLKELYHKTLTILVKGDLKDPHNLGRLDHKWAELIEHTGIKPGETGPLWILPQAYILAFDVATISEHLRASTHVQTLDDIQVHVRPGGTRFTLTIIARDRPGLIALLTGILAYRHIDIHSAKVFTWQGGMAVDVFEVTPPWQDYQAWDQINSTFQRLVAGEIDLSQTIAATRPLIKGLKALRSGTAPTIVIDNEASDFFTLIEVYAEDRIGLLHAITEAVHAQGLDIHRAIIGNKADLAADIFYVVDTQGEKITDEARQAQIVAALTASALDWNFPKE